MADPVRGPQLPGSPLAAGRIEETLFPQVRYLASIVEFSEDAILANDLDGTITIWNRGCERLFGYMAKEVLGAPVTVLSPENRHAPPTAAPLPGEPIGNFDTVLQCKDGNLLDI